MNAPSPSCYTPIRYRINDWHKLKDCKSNNSRELEIKVTDFVNNDLLEGIRISILHPDFGTLFTTVIKPSGALVTSEEERVYEPSQELLLRELYKFGFFIEFGDRLKIPADLYAYILSLKGIGFDKLKMVTPRATRRTYIIAFRSEKIPKWLLNTYQPNFEEYRAKLVSGECINLTDVSREKKFRWDWLDFVGGIDDILQNCDVLEPDIDENPDQDQYDDPEHFGSKEPGDADDEESPPLENDDSP